VSTSTAASRAPEIEVEATPGVDPPARDTEAPCEPERASADDASPLPRFPHVRVLPALDAYSCCHAHGGSKPAAGRRHRAHGLFPRLPASFRARSMATWRGLRARAHGAAIVVGGLLPRARDPPRALARFGGPALPPARALRAVGLGPPLRPRVGDHPRPRPGVIGPARAAARARAERSIGASDPRPWWLFRGQMGQACPRVSGFVGLALTLLLATPPNSRTRLSPSRRSRPRARPGALKRPCRRVRARTAWACGAPAQSTLRGSWLERRARGSTKSYPKRPASGDHPVG
jgi:hypothetical protein